MRWVILAFVVLGFAPRALAQDWGPLRGAEPVGPALFTNWTGFYVGGDWGYLDANADFSKATQPPIAYLLRNTTLETTSDPSEYPVLGTADHSAPDYGGFAGYNTQWQDLVLGVEGDYTDTSVSLTAPSSPIVRGAVSDGSGNSYTIAITGTGTLSNFSYGELRGRAGVILGNFLPYGFIGAAVGVANVNVTANIAGVCEPGSTVNCEAFSFSTTAGKSSALLYGAAVGAGIDYAITPNIFVRGEFEYLRFAPISNVTVAVTTARLGVGFKF